MYVCIYIYIYIYRERESYYKEIWLYSWRWERQPISCHFLACQQTFKMRYFKTRDIHIPVARSPLWVTFVLWVLIFVDLQYGSYFMAPFSYLEMWVVFQTFWKFMQPWFKQCWMRQTYLYFVIGFERSVSYLDRSRTFLPESLSNCRVCNNVHEWIPWR